MLGCIIGTEIITLLECTLLHYWKLITLSGFITVSMDSSAYFYYIIGVNTLSGIYYIIRFYRPRFWGCLVSKSCSILFLSALSIIISDLCL